MSTAEQRQQTAHLREIRRKLNGALTTNAEITGDTSGLATETTLGVISDALAGTLQVDQQRGLSLGFVPIDFSTAGPHALVAATAAKKAKVLHWQISLVGTGAFQFLSNATVIAGPFEGWGQVFESPFVAPGAGHLFETAVNQALQIELSNPGVARGMLVYVLEA